MDERPLNTPPLSPVEQLANVYDSLADDVFDAPIEIDEETNQRASRIAHAALEEALKPIKTSQAVSDATRGRPSIPKTNIRSKPTSSGLWTRRRETGWFARRFGLHPVVAVFLAVIAVAFEVFSWGSIGFGTILEIPVAPIVGLLTALMQKRLYQDDNLTALLKGLAATVLIALPIPLAPFIFVPAGILGLFWGRSRERMREPVPK